MQDSQMLDPHAVFCSLFRGGSKAHGQLLRGKVYSTIFGPTTPADYASHLAGHISLGIVPVLDDGSCRFGVIDVDLIPSISSGGEAHLIREAWKLGLRPFRSKSGGLHLYAFFRVTEAAEEIRDYLLELCQELSLPQNTDIFPRTSRDFLSWVNLPYFGDTRRMIMQDGCEVSFHEAMESLSRFLPSVKGATDA